jgi:hypothetical protein
MAFCDGKSASLNHGRAKGAPQASEKNSASTRRHRAPFAKTAKDAAPPLLSSVTGELTQGILRRQMYLAQIWKG